MGPLVVVVRQPRVEISLQLLQGPIDLLPEGHAIQLVQHGLVESLADPVRLGMPGLRTGMINVLDREIQFILVSFGCPAVLRAAIREHSIQGDFVMLEERQHSVIQQLGGSQRRFPVIQLGKSDFAVGIDEGLLIDPPDALERSDVEGVLRTTISGAFTLKLAMRFFVGLRLLQGHHLRLR